MEEIVVLFDVKKENVFLVPGNHDVENYEFRNESIHAIIKHIDVNPDAYIKYIKKTQNLNMAFDKYKDFYGESVVDKWISKPSSIMCLSWHGKMNIIILNTALISDDDKTHKEIIDIEALSNLKVKKGKPTIVLGHHDIDSIYASQRERIIRIFESFVLASKKYANITEVHPDIALDIKDGVCF